MKLLFSIFILFILNITSGQEEKKAAGYMDWFDTKIGKTNNSLFQGTEYEEEYLMKNEKHRFFPNFDFTLGNINFNGQQYFNVLCNYDVYGDQLLLKTHELTDASAILLDKKKVESFTIANHNFYNLKTNNKNFEDGFYELLVKNELFTIYKKYKKKKTQKLDKTYVYYIFKDKDKYVLYYENDFHKLKSVKNIGAIIKVQKDFLRNLMQKQTDLKKMKEDEKLIFVANKLFTHLISNEN